MVIFALVDKANKKVFKKKIYICYLIWFKKNKIEALFYIGGKVKVMILTFISKLRLKVYDINIGFQKIDAFIFKIFGII